jgi:hypothetical protein
MALSMRKRERGQGIETLIAVSLVNVRFPAFGRDGLFVSK